MTSTWVGVALAALNVVQTVALAYISNRWRRVNGELAQLHAPPDKPQR